MCVFFDDGEPELVASIKFASPTNKERIAARRDYASQCAGVLRQCHGLVIVDVGTTQLVDLHADVRVAMGIEAPSAAESGLAVFSYLAFGHDEDGRLVGWSFPLQAGGRLPTVPLWLAHDMAVPLDLEASHAAACTDLRIQLN